MFQIFFKKMTLKVPYCCVFLPSFSDLPPMNWFTKTMNLGLLGLDQLLLRFKQNDVQILDTIERYEYGNFLHILDPEGNKIELWEPNDAVYEKMGLDMGLQTNF